MERRVNASGWSRILVRHSDVNARQVDDRSTHMSVGRKPARPVTSAPTRMNTTLRASVRGRRAGRGVLDVGPRCRRSGRLQISPTLVPICGNWDVQTDPDKFGDRRWMEKNVRTVRSGHLGVIW